MAPGVVSHNVEVADTAIVERPLKAQTTMSQSVPRSSPLLERFGELFDENIAAKMSRVAQNALKDNNPPTQYPEWVPETGEDAGRYELREANFWTCGFFPGTLYSLIERATKFPEAFPTGECDKGEVLAKLTSLARTWAEPIYDMAKRTDTHDMSFIIQPSLRADWELFGTMRSKEAVLTAANSLASRFNEIAAAIRSWDVLSQNGVEIQSLEEDFLVIIDSMMNLDLLYYAGHHLNNPELAHMATAHARTVARANLRLEKNSRVQRSPFKGCHYSTFHVVNISPISGEIKQKMTAQGYASHSTWARGQAWGIFGYAQTYLWTKDVEFLDLSCGLADHFIARLETSPDLVEEPVDDTDTPAFRKASKRKGRHVPLWDFDAPIDRALVLRDSSAGVIAANGMLILYQALIGLGRDVLARWYLGMALTLIEDALAFSLSREKARFVSPTILKGNGPVGEALHICDTTGQRFDAILKNATANYNARDRRRYWNHGLVYGDYYVVEFGNRLLRLGLI